jgi:hypothetical protein
MQIEYVPQDLTVPEGAEGTVRAVPMTGLVVVQWDLHGKRALQTSADVLEPAPISLERLRHDLVEAQKVTSQIAQIVVDDTPFHPEQHNDVSVDPKLFAQLRVACASQQKASEGVLDELRRQARAAGTVPR